MKINSKDLKALKLLLDDKEIRLGAFGQKGKSLIDTLAQNGIVTKKKLTKSSTLILLLNSKALINYVTMNSDANLSEEFLALLGKDGVTRAELAKAGVSTKAMNIGPQSGLYLNGQNVNITIDGEELVLNFPSKCALFVSKEAHIQIPSDVTIVGVENFENIVYMKKQIALFSDNTTGILFVSRGKYLQECLKSISNRYVHFGDIDLAGIAIYQNEYLPIVGDRGTFFVPDTIEQDIKTGLKSLYVTQETKYRTLSGSDNKLQALIDLIRQHKRCIEQDFYINLYHHPYIYRIDFFFSLYQIQSVSEDLCITNQYKFFLQNYNLKQYNK